MEILNKDMIQHWILPHLTLGKRGFSSRVPIDQIVELILYKLKTGCQWRHLPIKQFFETEPLTWQGVYYYFNRWSKLGCWRKVWVHLLAEHHSYLDLSSAQLDGSHTPAKNGGEAIGYQNRKAAKTTNSLFLADNQGLMLAMASPQEGNHHDLFEVTFHDIKHFGQSFVNMRTSAICTWLHHKLKQSKMSVSFFTRCFKCAGTGANLYRSPFTRLQNERK
jgi:transposase